MDRRRLLPASWVAAAVAALMLSVVVPAAAGTGPEGPNTEGRTVDIQLLQYSDWHGAISDAPVLGAYLHQDEAANPNTIILTGGDDFGGTEPVSSLNDDLPAILVQNAFGTDVAGLGNHNFDGGIANLQDKIDLADYTYISANLANVDDNVTGVEPYVIFEFNPQIKVAVIGYTNEEAPILVFPGNFGTIEITDAATALQTARDQAKADGADIFVAIGHKGVRSFDAGGNPQGELIDLANALEGFDVILGDHTDVGFTGEINGAIVAEAESNGDTYNRITLTVKPGSGKIVATTVESIVPDPAGITPDADIAALTQPFFDSLAAAFDGVIGQSGGFWQRASSGYERLGEAELGNLFTDALLSRYPEVDVVLQNAGGIRSTLSPSNYVVTDPTVDRDGLFPDDVVVGDLFSLHNFGNIVTTQSVTGAQLHDAIEHGLTGIPAGRFPQIAGFQVIYDTTLPDGARILSMILDDGTAILDDTSQTLTLATNNFVSAGGDGYTMLADPSAVTREVLTDVIGLYITSQGLVTPFFDCRLVDENPTGPATTRFDNPLGPFATRPDCP